MIAKKLKELRFKKGLTQADLSNILGVAQQTIGSWETNKSSPNLEMLKIIADFFNVSTDYILGRENSKQDDSLSREQIKLLNDYNSLSTAGRNLLKALMASLLMSHSQKHSNVVQSNNGGNNFLNVGGGANYVNTI